MGTRWARVSVNSGGSKRVKWEDLGMEIISNPTQDDIKKAAHALKDGHLVAFPTETVYGLGADANNETALNRIYSVKGRPADHPLIVHISSINYLEEWALSIPVYAKTLAQEFWPGPMTLILRKKNVVSDLVTGGQDSIGLRVPAQPVAIALLNEFNAMGGLGVAAPSANRFGAVSPTTADAVAEELGKFFELGDFILDGGMCQLGIESTIIDCTKDSPSILRPGALTVSMIEAVCGKSVIENLSEIRASGLLESHYSPKAKVEINAIAIPGDGFLAMEKFPTPIGTSRLASPGTVEQYARELYAALRSGDAKGLKRIVVIPPDGDGVAVAVRDRLSKAAAR